MIMENILAKLLMVKGKEREFFILIVVIDMKVIGKMIKGKEKEFFI